MAKGKQARAAVSKKDAQTGVFFGCYVIPLVMLQADPVSESPVPVAVMPSVANLFNLLKGNHIMKVINGILFL